MSVISQNTDDSHEIASFVIQLEYFILIGQMKHLEVKH